MACSGCNASIDCPDDVTFPYSLTSGPVLPFLLECPSGYDCSVARTLTLNCCNHILTLPVPFAATAQQISDILNALTIQCQRYSSQCGLQLPPPFTGSFFTGNPFSYFTNKSVTATAVCPDGSVTTFTLDAGSIAELSSPKALAQGTLYAQRQASFHQICLGSLANVNFVGTSYNESIVATGAQTSGLVVNPWTVVSGSAPAGMTLGPSIAPFTTLPLTGTPTTVANYSFTVKFTVPSGDSVTKTFNISVTNASVITLTPDIGSMGVAWTATSGATSYKLYRSPHGANTFTLIDTTSGTTFTDTTCVGGTSYDYQVYAYSGSTALGNSAIATGTPTNLAATDLVCSAGDGFNALDWDSVIGAATYSLYRGTTPGGPYPTLVGTTALLALGDNGLSNGTTYYYVVYPNVNATTGPASNEASGTPQAALHFANLVWNNPPNVKTDLYGPISGYATYSNVGNVISENQRAYVNEGGTFHFQNDGALTYTGPSVSCNVQVNFTKWFIGGGCGSYPSLRIVVTHSSTGTLLNQLYTAGSHSGIVNLPFTVPASFADTITVIFTADLAADCSFLAETESNTTSTFTPV